MSHDLQMYLQSSILCLCPSIGVHTTICPPSHATEHVQRDGLHMEITALRTAYNADIACKDTQLAQLKETGDMLERQLMVVSNANNGGCGASDSSLLKRAGLAQAQHESDSGTTTGVKGICSTKLTKKHLADDMRSRVFQVELCSCSHVGSGTGRPLAAAAVALAQHANLRSTGCPSPPAR
jgi:hypothetical protein